MGHNVDSGHNRYFNMRTWYPFFFFSFWHKLKDQLQEGTKCNHPGRVSVTRGKSRKNGSMRSNLPSNHYIVTGHNKTFDVDLILWYWIFLQIKSGSEPLEQPFRTTSSKSSRTNEKSKLPQIEDGHNLSLGAIHCSFSLGVELMSIGSRKLNRFLSLGPPGHRAKLMCNSVKFWTQKYVSQGGSKNTRLAYSYYLKIPLNWSRVLYHCMSSCHFASWVLCMLPWVVVSWIVYIVCWVRFSVFFIHLVETCQNDSWGTFERECSSNN